MRVVYHHRTHRSHGAEAVHIRGLVTALREMGHEVDVLSPPGADPFGGSTSAKPQSAPNPLWRFITTHTPQLLFEVLEMFYNVFAFYQLARTRRPDLIYERYFVFSVAAGWIARLRGCRIVYEINDSSYLTHRVRGLALVRLARMIERRVINRADLVVVISRAMGDILEQGAGVDPRKILILPNAVHESSVVSAVEQAAASPADDVVIGCVGFFVPWHGLDLLVQAFAALEEAPGRRLRLLLVGDGPVRPDVEQQAARLGVSDRLTITGMMPHDEVRSWLTKMHVAVLADSNEYGSPMKIFEYMAAGKAIVAPDYGPVLEVLQEGVNGLVFPRRDVPALRDALARLAADPALRQRLAEHARTSVLARHTWRRNAERLEAALRAVHLGHSAPSSAGVI